MDKVHNIGWKTLSKNSKVLRRCGTRFFFFSVCDNFVPLCCVTMFLIIKKTHAIKKRLQFKQLGPYFFFFRCDGWLFAKTSILLFDENRIKKKTRMLHDINICDSFVAFFLSRKFVLVWRSIFSLFLNAII